MPGEVAPVEILRAALQATKASGQPDWATRLSAVRALAALPPEEGEPEPATPSIVVYDLPPGANPVLHRPASGAAEAPAAPAEAPSEQAASDTHVSYCEPPTGRRADREVVSSRGDSPDAFVSHLIHTTNNPETSQRWRAELAAGRLPQTSDNAP